LRFPGEAHTGFAFFFGPRRPHAPGPDLWSLLSRFLYKNCGMRDVFWVIMALALVCAQPAVAQREKLSWDDRVVVEKAWPNAIKSSTGLRYVVLKEGTGDAKPQAGDRVAVIYQGRLLDGTVFGESTDRAKPFQVRVGRDELIAAWEETLKQMKVGEKRLIVVPYELGYGTRGDPPRIPRRATLVFEIELLSIHKE
jgi:FKBP-type peptidyl-prolyl cis-trans isomerase